MIERGKWKWKSEQFDTINLIVKNYKIIKAFRLCKAESFLKALYFKKGVIGDKCSHRSF